MKTKFYDLYADGIDANGVKHTVTVVGKFTQETIKKECEVEIPVEVKPNTYTNGTLKFNKKRLHRTLTIGVSICNPEDEFSREEGIRIAKKRIANGEDAGTIETNDVTMLTEDLIMAELLGKLTYITNHIDNYIQPKEKYIPDFDRFA